MSDIDIHVRHRYTCQTELVEYSIQLNKTEINKNTFEKVIRKGILIIYMSLISFCYIFKKKQKHLIRGRILIHYTTRKAYFNLFAVYV